MLLAKAQKFCDYQERYQQEVRDKLYSWGTKPEEIEQIICQLVEQNYINEERFARAFARGKFRIKHWGKNKIRQELKFRKISEYCIKKGLLEIPDEDYLETLKNVIEKKSRGVKTHGRASLHKIAQYAISRGFESDLVWGILNKL
ncbi:MAG: RecX family transcriptional regulator [Bacteroidales bacterium]|nr:RecX family transcriptional regulator [Bacteroidales bacterium]